MADYVKATNFAIKDTLTTGDPAKVVKGTEIDTEFTAIASAVASKRDSNSIVPIANGGTGTSSTTYCNLAANVTNVLPIANGGTGQTTASAAINALVPSQSSNSGKVLGTNGTAVSWVTAGTGNVVGPGGGVVADTFAIFDGTTGALIKSSYLARELVFFSDGTKISIGASGTSNNLGVGATGIDNAITGGSNTAVGYSAMNSLSSGTNNTAVGESAALILGSGTHNTVVGSDAGGSLSSGTYNTAVGYNSGALLLNGTYNTAVGTDSLGATAPDNCSALGYQANVTGDNQVQLGNSSTTTYVYGTVQNRSDERDKADIRDTRLGLNFITALRPVDYKWDMREDYKPAKPNRKSYETDEAYKEAMTAWQQAANISNITHNGTHKRTRYHHGLVAQEVKQVLDAQGIDFGGYQDHSVNGGDDVLSIGYDELIAPLIKSVQELTARLEAAEATIQQLQGN